MIKIHSISINVHRAIVALLLGLFVFLSTNLFDHFGSESDTIEITLDDSQDESDDSDEIEKLKLRSHYTVFNGSSALQSFWFQGMMFKHISETYEELDFQILIPPPEARV